MAARVDYLGYMIASGFMGAHMAFGPTAASIREAQEKEERLKQEARANQEAEEEKKWTHTEKHGWNRDDP